MQAWEDGGAHGVHALLAVGAGLHDLPRELDEFQVNRRKFPAWNVHLQQATVASQDGCETA